MLDSDFSCENLILERDLAGWMGWLADGDFNVRQYAARSATQCLERYGLTWVDVARLVAGEVRRRQARKLGR